MKTLNYLKTMSLLAVTLAFTSCDKDSVAEANPTIDLAAEEISFSVDKTSQFSGMATIKGTLTNIADDYISDQGQQTLFLYERQLGVNQGTIVAQKSFTNLASGDSVEVSFSRAWNASSPAEGEFPPEYTILISYDPDIFLDSNKNNDDINNTNNQLMKSGMDINDLF